MPFELGLDIACRSFVQRYSDKCALIFAAEKYEYQKFLSDIAGQDIENHKDDPRLAIEGVRAFLAPQLQSPPPGPRKIAEQYDEFRNTLPEMLARAGVATEEMQFSDLSWSITEWLAALT